MFRLRDEDDGQSEHNADSGTDGTSDEDGADTGEGDTTALVRS